jgi:CheY-like chemotaxis protein
MSTMRNKRGKPLLGQSILIVEDEALIALDLHQTLRDSGASVLAATSLGEGLDMLTYAEVTAAVLDMNLGGSDCSPLCTELHARSIPFLFYTAQPMAEIVRASPNAPVVLKPELSEKRIVLLLEELLTKASC